jgi:hypothetical protein
VSVYLNLRVLYPAFLQVCSGTAIMLALGRFAFMPLHRRDLQRSATAAGPKTTGESAAAAAHSSTF